MCADFLLHQVLAESKFANDFYFFKSCYGLQNSTGLWIRKSSVF